MKSHTYHRLSLLLLMLLLVGVLAACGATSEEAAPAAAPTEAPVPTEDPAEEPTATAEPAASEGMTATTAITATQAMTAADAPTSTEAPASQSRLFTIDPAQSEARFKIDEVLRGSPVTVVGVTSLVSGNITVNPANPAETTVGVITIDANDLTTDQNMRNRAIRNFVLQSGQYPTITFEPTVIEGLPATSQAGDAFSFTVTGNLTIREITNPVVFTVEVTADSDTQIRGLAQATIARSAFELNIPSVPFVADVSEDVVLELQFVALAQ